MKIRLLLCALIATLSIAADNLATGAWTMITEMSTLKSCPASALRGRTLTIPSEIAAASANARTVRSAKPAATAGTPAVVSRTNVTSDGHFLTVSPTGNSDCKIVYEKQ
jgi:hypothetical protein